MMLLSFWVGVWGLLRWNGAHYAEQAGLEFMETHLALPSECGILVEYHHA